MKRNKVIEIILSLMVKIKIKDKRIRYAVIAALGLGLAAVTQIPVLEGEITSLVTSQGAVEGAVEEGVGKVAEDIIGKVLENLF